MGKRLAGERAVLNTELSPQTRRDSRLPPTVAHQLPGCLIHHVRKPLNQLPSRLSIRGEYLPSNVQDLQPTRSSSSNHSPMRVFGLDVRCAR